MCYRCLSPRVNSRPFSFFHEVLLNLSRIRLLPGSSHFAIPQSPIEVLFGATLLCDLW